MSEFAFTPEVERRAREVFAGIGLMTHLGVELVRLDADTAELAFAVDGRHTNYRGALHGGAVAAVADTAVFFPGRLLPSGRRFTTEGLELHYFRPAARGDRIAVRAAVVRVGRRLATVEARALDPAGREIARGLATLLDVEA